MRSSSSLVKIVIMIPRNEDINHTHDPHIRATRIFPSRRSCFSLPSSRIPKKKGGGREREKKRRRKKEASQARHAQPRGAKREDFPPPYRKIPKILAEPGRVRGAGA